ncbi:MAG TPA: M1 family metallopeptidase, partial [Gemmatimonadaceae bacterium]
MLPLLLLVLGGTTVDSADYWQQQVVYRITASLDEPSGVLTGRARITYVNQSPDTLRDFYVHQYLNAFRPGSRWSAVDSAEGRVRFQHLADPDYAFERITQATIAGQAAAPDYPFAPDSTVAHWRLARPLAPGDTLTAEIAWRARPSTLPRRQGRQGRRFDFAQWYPKVVVYDRFGWEAHPLYPAGEFYGEFATFDVALDLPVDQVIGATGVPVQGDPGWDHAKADPDLTVDYQRDFSPPPRDPTTPGDVGVWGCGEVGAGRKCVRFLARDVHHFAFSLNPEYRYEQGRYKNVVVRVLYQPGDSATWGKGIAVRRTEIALGWLDSLFGTFVWPQLTNVHRIEGGSTEFPMMVMDGSVSQGLVNHEVGHNYLMGILANNEWREGWLDEGFSNFQGNWFNETHELGSNYAGVETGIVGFDLDRWSEPVSLVSDRYRDFATYNAIVYNKAQLFYEQLRYVVGDSTMRDILRTYYARWKLKHVDERAFRDVAEEVSHQDLSWLFGQWLHGTPLIDYKIGRVERQPVAGGGWRTRVTIHRQGDGMMPVEIGDRVRVYARSTGQPETEVVEFTSANKPGRLMLDPRVRAHDWNMLNNEERGLRWAFSKSRLRETKVDDPTRQAARRDRLLTRVLPVAWSNEAGGLTLALRSRENYLGRFEKRLEYLTWELGDNATQPHGVYVRLGNPVSGYVPRTETSVAGWYIEGRAGAALHVDRSLRQHQTFGPDAHAGLDAIWMAT